MYLIFLFIFIKGWDMFYIHTHTHQKSVIHEKKETRETGRLVFGWEEVQVPHAVEKSCIKLPRQAWR